MKRVWMKIESSRNSYIPYCNAYDFKTDALELFDLLKAGKAIEVKVGCNHYFIDKNDDNDDAMDAVNYVMWYVERYLNK